MPLPQEEDAFRERAYNVRTNPPPPPQTNPNHLQCLIGYRQDLQEQEDSRGETSGIPYRVPARLFEDMPPDTFMEAIARVMVEAIDEETWEEEEPSQDQIVEALVDSGIERGIAVRTTEVYDAPEEKISWEHQFIGWFYIEEKEPSLDDIVEHWVEKGWRREVAVKAAEMYLKGKQEILGKVKASWCYRFVEWLARNPFEMVEAVLLVGLFAWRMAPTRA